jgi:lysophospholipase L1-like esterase
MEPVGSKDLTALMRLIKYFAFNLIIILAVSLILEGALRLLNVNPRVDNPFFLLVRVFEYPDYFEKDSSLFWRLRPNIKEGTEFLVPGSYRTNSLGLRGTEPNIDTLSQQVRVACFGNSCTFGWRLNESETYPQQLEQALSQSPSQQKFTVFNCGIPGYSSFQGRKLLQELVPILKPQFVTLCYGWNDHWAAGFDIEDKKQQMAPQWVLDIQNTASKSYLYRATKYLLLSRSERSREYTYNRQSPTYRVSLDDYRENLLDMVNYCLTHGIKPIIVTAPIPDIDPGVDSPIETYHTLYCQIGVFVANEMNVSVVDAASLFMNHPEFWDDPKKDFIHYNAKGAAFLAEELARVISK